MWNDRQLSRIYDKTGGYCYHCGKKIVWVNYGRRDKGVRGGWEVDHSRPKNRGGSDHMTNLVPSCWKCNSQKGDMTSAEFRKVRGYLPLSGRRKSR